MGYKHHPVRHQPEPGLFYLTFYLYLLSFRLPPPKWVICWNWPSSTRSSHFSTEKMLCRKNSQWTQLAGIFYMLSKPCTSPQSHLRSFLQSDKKSQLDTWCGNFPAKWLRLSRSIFWGGFSEWRISGIYPSAQPRQQLTGNSLIKEAKETQSLLELRQSEKWRTCFRSCLIGYLNQTKLEETAWCIFLWNKFFCIEECT